METTPQTCPEPGCSAQYRDITWTGGSPPYGPDHWQCKFGHEWTTEPVKAKP